MSTSIAPIGGITSAGVAEGRRQQSPSEPGSGIDRDRIPTAEESGPQGSPAVLDESIQEVIFGDRKIEFSYDDSLNRVIVKVRAGKDGEVVRQIPPEHFLAFATKFRELLGVLFDEVV